MPQQQAGRSRPGRREGSKEKPEERTRTSVFSQMTIGTESGSFSSPVPRHPPGPGAVSADTSPSPRHMGEEGQRVCPVCHPACVLLSHPRVSSATPVAAEDRGTCPWALGARLSLCLSVSCQGTARGCRSGLSQSPEDHTASPFSACSSLHPGERRPLRRHPHCRGQDPGLACLSAGPGLTGDREGHPGAADGAAHMVPWHPASEGAFWTHFHTREDPLTATAPA